MGINAIASVEAMEQIIEYKKQKLTKMEAKSAANENYQIRILKIKKETWC
jgi:hypothetical protein